MGGTQTGKAVRLLQQKMPSARVVYASATAATDPQHVGYCSRLGLWKAEADEEIADNQDDEAFLKGDEPFDTFIDFLKTIRGSRSGGGGRGGGRGGGDPGGAGGADEWSQNLRLRRKFLDAAHGLRLPNSVLDRLILCGN